MSLCIDEAAQPYRKVVVDGSAELVHDLGEDDAWRDLYRETARRYIDDDAAENYIQATIDQPRGLYRVRLADARVRTWRMPVPRRGPRRYLARSLLRGRDDVPAGVTPRAHTVFLPPTAVHSEFLGAGSR